MLRALYANGAQKSKYPRPLLIIHNLLKIFNFTHLASEHSPQSSHSVRKIAGKVTMGSPHWNEHPIRMWFGLETHENPSKLKLMKAI